MHDKLVCLVGELHFHLFVTSEFEQMATANTVGRVVVLSMGIVAVCFMVVIAVAMIVVPVAVIVIAMIVVPVIVIAVAMVVIPMIMVPVIVIVVVIVVAVAMVMVVCRGSYLGARWLLGVTSREGDSVDAGDSQAQQGGETMILHDIH